MAGLSGQRCGYRAINPPTHCDNDSILNQAFELLFLDDRRQFDRTLIFILLICDGFD
jgi:hypothetical protein